MIAEIGVTSIDDLFDEIPASLRVDGFPTLATGDSEMDLAREFAARSRMDELAVCFAGGGCYDHHIPAAVWDITSRGEFLTAYTPYQAEASQGTLQLIYEFQTMISALTGMEVANASVYDGGSALAEAVLMAVRLQKRHASKQVLSTAALHPNYFDTATSIVRGQGIVLDCMAPSEDGLSVPDAADSPLAVVIQQPNFFGNLEDVDTIVDWAHEQGALVIAVVNPISLGLLRPPGSWGERGADIVVGDGQPLGIPMASGGPSFGFMCTRSKFVRQLPGRIAGRTVDVDGKSGFTLTLQAREQHIRRGKATSNICTNQGLLVTAGTIYMSLMGPAGLRSTAQACHDRTLRLVEKIEAETFAVRAMDVPFFHECVIDLQSISADALVDRLASRDILAGVPLGHWWPDRATQLLVCATERRTQEEIDSFVDSISWALGANA